MSWVQAPMEWKEEGVASTTARKEVEWFLSEK